MCDVGSNELTSPIPYSLGCLRKIETEKMEQQKGKQLFEKSADLNITGKPEDDKVNWHQGTPDFAVGVA